MAQIKPFRALRYNEARIGSLERVVAPPYDVIDPGEQQALYERSPNNAVRLILNVDNQRYASAASLFARWTAENVLVPDPAPAIYLYSVRFQLPSGALVARHDTPEYERFGIIAALKLEEYATGTVLPHERTFSGPKTDRLELLRACRANLSPIFGIFAKQGLRLRDLRRDSPPVAQVDLGVQGVHTLWRVENRATVSRLVDALRDELVLIADGHHRYETALRYRRERLAGKANDTSSVNFIMACLVNMEEPGLVVLPTHRLLRTVNLRIDRLLPLLSQWAEIREIEPCDDGFATMKDNLVETSSRACVIGIIGDMGNRICLLRAGWDAIPFDSEVPQSVRRLEVAALHQAVIPAALGLSPGAGGDPATIIFEKDADQAWLRVRAGEAQTAFILPPPSLRLLREVCKEGVTMPEKSTYFFPKLLTGLTFRALDEHYQ